MSSENVSLNTESLPDKRWFFEMFASGPSFRGGLAEYTWTSRYIHPEWGYVEAGVIFFSSLIIEVVEIWLTLWYVKYDFSEKRLTTTPQKSNRANRSLCGTPQYLLIRLKQFWHIELLLNFFQLRLCTNCRKIHSGRTSTQRSDTPSSGWCGKYAPGVRASTTLGNVGIHRCEITERITREER